MGRLATHLAAIVTDAENLPSSQKLPNVSLIDALLPRRCANVGSLSKDSKPLDSNIGRRTTVTYYDIKKDSNGKRSVVAHKSPVPSVHDEIGKDDDKTKKNGNGGKNNNNNNNQGGNKNKNDNKKDEKKDNKGGDKNPSNKPFTDDEDAELKALVAKPDYKWKDIAKEMKRGQQTLKDRWKEIGDASDPDDRSGEEKKDDKKDEKKDGGGGETKQMSKKERQAAKKAEKEKAEAGGGGEEKKQQNEGKKDKSKTAAKAPSKVGSAGGGEARFTMNEWLTLQEDSLFSFGELQCLSELIMRDQSQTWLRIAATFYDKTGRRVHPDDIREKFEEMATMG
ncbi:hypothetical protein LTR56_020185 [Elasticomyces elasticus]|nr:hypothetical protein LTR56_020185 [Elasticomyces elasticus]KAK3663609.1 hypothetical protein LTR22_005549 [Elasticomyces elasticus]KAK5764195.1 hypothetical protein LTS12_005646 [Elasticomyces elasticus]